jgi:hypothetical protein
LQRPPRYLGGYEKKETASNHQGVGKSSDGDLDCGEFSPLSAGDLSPSN